MVSTDARYRILVKAAGRCDLNLLDEFLRPVGQVHSLSVFGDEGLLKRVLAFCSGPDGVGEG